MGNIVNKINSTAEIKMTLKLFNLIFSLLLYIHFVGCIWYFVIRLDDDWIPPLDYMFVRTEFFEQSLNFQYWHCFYHAVLMLNGDEIGPRTIKALWFISGILILGAVINANIFGNLAVIIGEMNKKASRFQEKIDTANTAMKNLKIPNKLQTEVINYLLFTQSNLDKQNEMDKFKTMISPSLRKTIARHVFSKIIFKDATEACT